MEHDTQRLGQPAERADTEAARPRKAVGRRVHVGGVAQSREDAPGENVGDTQGGEQPRDDGHAYLLKEPPHWPELRGEIFLRLVEFCLPPFVNEALDP